MPVKESGYLAGLLGEEGRFSDCTGCREEATERRRLSRRTKMKAAMVRSDDPIMAPTMARAAWVTDTAAPWAWRIWVFASD